MPKFFVGKFKRKIINFLLDALFWLKWRVPGFLNIYIRENFRRVRQELSSRALHRSARQDWEGIITRVVIEASEDEESAGRRCEPVELSGRRDGAIN